MRLRLIAKDEYGIALDDGLCLSCYGGGGKGGGGTQYIPVTPPPAPVPEQAETLQPVEEDEETKKAIKQGAKSLQIPLATTTTDNTTVGGV